MLKEFTKENENQGNPYNKFAHKNSPKTIVDGIINNLIKFVLKNLIIQNIIPKYNEQ